MGILVVNWRFAELFGFWVYIVTIVPQALQPVMAVISVKPAVSEYCSGCVNAVHDWRSGAYLCLIARSPDNFLNASAVASQGFILCIVR